MKKTERIEIRTTKSDKKYLDNISKKLDCTVTDYILDSCIQGRYTMVKIDNMREYSKLLSSMSNNMNQIARALNTIVSNPEFEKEQRKQIEKYLLDGNELLSKLVNDELFMQRKVYKLIKENRKLVYSYEQEEFIDDIIDEEHGSTAI